MARNKRFASTLETKLVPYLRSIEEYLAAAGIVAKDFSSYTEMRQFFETAATLIRGGGHLWAPTADAVLVKLNDLQDVLPTILKKMPPGFTLEWNTIAEQIERENRAMLE